ncbi:MAG: ATP-binding cassette domain-containing protein [Pseudonocardiaceae bacterium]
MTASLSSSTSQKRQGEASVEVEGLRKSFGKFEALKGIDLRVAPGTVLGLLGPNGAGKMTTVRCLTTLARPTGGVARVAGYDVIRESARVRASIALAGQHAAVDGVLTGRENLVLIGRLLGLGRRAAHDRAAELLERFDLGDAADRRAATYSGGMRRRLDLAVSLTSRPRVLFFDEPTTGLDPRSRLVVWDMIRQLRVDGLTIVLTTQYLDEADELADELADTIVLIDDGRVIAEGTPAELKQRVGTAVCRVELADPKQTEAAASSLSELADRTGGELTVDPERGTMSLPAIDGLQTLAEVTNELRRAGVDVVDVRLRRPSLDEVFLALTGRHGEEQS